MINNLYLGNLKKRIIKSMIWSVVFYRSESWTMRKEDIKRLEAFEMQAWHRMEKSAGFRTGQMKRYFKRWTKRITYRNDPKPTEKLAGQHNERRLPSKNYNREKKINDVNVREKEKRNKKYSEAK